MIDVRVLEASQQISRRNSQSGLVILRFYNSLTLLRSVILRCRCQLATNDTVFMYSCFLFGAVLLQLVTDVW